MAEEKETKQRTVITSDKAYDNAQKSLITKLTALKPETAEACAANTIKELKNTVAMMKKAAETVKNVA